MTAKKVKEAVKKSPGRPKSLPNSGGSARCRDREDDQTARPDAGVISPSPQETREKLLEAATALFAENGMGVTSLAKVAAAAGVTSAMVHYYFKTKEQLVEAVVVERLGRFLNMVLGESDFDPDEPLDYVLSVVPRLAAAAEANPWMPGLWVREVISENGGLREHVFSFLPTAMFGRLAECYIQGREKGKYSGDVEPHLLLFTVITNYMLPLAAKGLLERLPGMGELTSGRLVRHAQAVLRHGLSGLPEQHGRRKGRERSRS